MRSRSSTPGRTRATTPEAAALCALALLGGCLDASRGSGAGDEDGGAGERDGAPADPDGDAAAAPDAAAPLADVHCPAVEGALVVDGLDEEPLWVGITPTTFDPTFAPLRIEIEAYQDDAAVSFRCAHDAATLFLFFDVYDGAGAANGAIITSESDPRQNDAIALFLDGAGDRAGTYAADDHWLVVDPIEQEAQRAGSAMASLTAVKAAAESAWRLEAAIDLDTIAPAGVRADVMGFDLALIDDDNFEGSAPDLVAFWEAEQGACVDCCPDAEPEPWCSTTQFGTLALDP